MQCPHNKTHLFKFTTFFTSDSLTDILISGKSTSVSYNIKCHVCIPVVQVSILHVQEFNQMYTVISLSAWVVYEEDEDRPQSHTLSFHISAWTLKNVTSSGSQSSGGKEHTCKAGIVTSSFSFEMRVQRLSYVVWTAKPFEAHVWLVILDCINKSDLTWPFIKMIFIPWGTCTDLNQNHNQSSHVKSIFYTYAFTFSSRGSTVCAAQNTLYTTFPTTIFLTPTLTKTPRQNFNSLPAFRAQMGSEAGLSTRQRGQMSTMDPRSPKFVVARLHAS